MRRRPTQLIRPGGKRISLGHWKAARLALAAFVLSMFVLTTTASAETLPTASYTIWGISGTNGWYKGSARGNYVLVNWTLYDPDHLILQGCQTPVPVNGPTTGQRSTCVVTLVDGRPPLTFTTGLIRIDREPPTGVSGNFSRAADFNGWYNHPVGISWRGSDATSGIASCSAVTYSGPDRASAPIGGGCTDRAGNSASASASINYDATAPVLSKLSVTSRAGSDVVRWRSTSPADTLVLQRWARGSKERPVVFRGTGRAFTDKRIRSNIEYTYAARTVDQAGNASREVSVIALPKVLTLQKTRYVPRVAPRPILRWAAKRGASYYHVQLFRRSKRIFASWPTTHQLGLPAAWRWAGHRYRLRPGHYRWYVWVGLGPRSFAQYRAIGSAKFIVPKRSR
jgi:hypothetical protein